MSRLKQIGQVKWRLFSPSSSSLHFPGRIKTTIGSRAYKILIPDLASSWPSAMLFFYSMPNQSPRRRRPRRRSLIELIANCISFRATARTDDDDDENFSLLVERERRRKSRLFIRVRTSMTGTDRKFVFFSFLLQGEYSSSWQTIKGGKEKDPRLAILASFSSTHKGMNPRLIGVLRISISYCLTEVGTLILKGDPTGTPCKENNKSSEIGFIR